MTGQPVVRWGFIGAGFVASRALAPAVHDATGAVLQVVASRQVERAGVLHPVRAVDRYEEVCTAPDVDVVYVSLPNNDHLPWVMAALETGKHVLCEKPLGLSAPEVSDMAEAAHRADRLLVEACWNLWHPRTRRAQELTARSAGPCDVRAWFTFDGVPADNYRLDPRRGGGALLDLGSYVVSAAQWALDGDLQVLSASQRLGDTGVDLTTTAVLAVGDSRAHVTASIDRPASQGLEIRTPDLRIDLPDPSFTSWRSPSQLRVVEGGVSHLESFEACDPYRLMVEAVSMRSLGGDAWVLPLTTTAAVTTTLDDIARVAGAA
ncbi:MAG: Gfo/Idh/MocA family oxidoreductase [Actinomycetes bacterium]